MSSFVRTIQKRLLAKAKVPMVPVYLRSGGLRLHIVGHRHRLCAAHVAYDLDGTPHKAAAPKLKRVRKAVIADTPAAAKPKAPRKPRAKKVAAQVEAA